MTEYPAGTVAVATVRGVPNVRVMRGQREWLTDAPTLDGPYWHADRDVTDVRPLVVLDLDGPQHLADYLRRNARADVPAPSMDALMIAAADQIESQTKPPRIPEPEGLGAVIETEDGVKYVRVADPLDGWMADRDWQRIGGAINTVRNFGWYDLNAVRVLSPGVES